MTELKPCPFCGKSAEMNGNDLLGLVWVYCGRPRSQCAASPEVERRTKRGAIKAWNTRNGEAPRPAANCETIRRCTHVYLRASTPYRSGDVCRREAVPGSGLCAVHVRKGVA